MIGMVSDSGQDPCRLWRFVSLFAVGLALATQLNWLGYETARIPANVAVTEY